MHEPERSFQHPALGAALSARNAVAAEMAVAGRARLHPDEACWALALDHAVAGRRALAQGDRVGDRLGAIAVGLRAHAAREAYATHSADPASAPAPRPAARRRRERLEMVVWFAVGGGGGLALAATLRALEVYLAWR
ncbi:MAG: hypothetical protein RI990_1674 [Planctomycetota bacterium]|jgi:hypothetical protein